MPSRRAFLASLGTACLAGCLASESPAPPTAVTSTWPMPGHDPGRTNHAPAATGPLGKPAEVWREQATAPLAGPVIADGTLFLGAADGVVRALDAANGVERWRAQADDSAGVPHVHDGRVHVPTAGGVVTLSAADGTVLWRAKAPERRGLLVAEHGLYHLSAGEQAAVVARERSGGGERWRTPLDKPWTSTLFAAAGQVLVSTGGAWDRPQRFDAATGEFLGDQRPPSGGADMLVEQFVQDGRVFAGKEMFQTVAAWPVGSDANDWTRRVENAACWRLSGGDGRFYAHAQCLDRKGLFAMSTANGDTAWHAGNVTQAVSRPVVAAETVLVPTKRALRCHDSADGRLLWTHPAAGVEEGLVVADDLVFATSGHEVRALRTP